MEDKLIKRLMTSLKCDSCGQHYEVYNIDILGHREGMWFLRVFCPSCHTRCLVAAVVKESRAPAVVSDLNDIELKKFKDGDVVEVEDVLNMHVFLKDFDGDFSQIFTQE